MVETFKKVNEQLKTSAAMLESHLAAEAESVKTTLLAERLNIQIGESIGTSSDGAPPICVFHDDQQAVAFKDEQASTCAEIGWKCKRGQLPVPLRLQIARHNVPAR